MKTKSKVSLKCSFIALLVISTQVLSAECIFTWKSNEENLTFNMYYNRQLIESNIKSTEIIRPCKPGIYEIKAINEVGMQSDYSERVPLSFRFFMNALPSQ